MCVIECTLTACTTKSAKPWPSESSQKALVRSASPAVKSRRGSGAFVCAAAGAAGGSPSMV